jgi:ribose/xylose/arabinose/galactoside ABC-type transport system permease subunit
MANGNYGAEWFRKAWPLLLFRWAVFAAVIAGVALVRGEGIVTAALIGVFVGAVLNAAWQWVA